MQNNNLIKKKSSFYHLAKKRNSLSGKENNQLKFAKKEYSNFKAFLVPWRQNKIKVSIHNNCETPKNKRSSLPKIFFKKIDIDNIYMNDSHLKKKISRRKTNFISPTKKFLNQIASFNVESANKLNQILKIKRISVLSDNENIDKLQLYKINKNYANDGSKTLDKRKKRKTKTHLLIQDGNTKLKKSNFLNLNNIFGKNNFSESKKSSNISISKANSNKFEISMRHNDINLDTTHNKTEKVKLNLENITQNSGNLKTEKNMKNDDIFNKNRIYIKQETKNKKNIKNFFCCLFLNCFKPINEKDAFL